MNPETFFDKFGLLADTPNGVQKLRVLILQLAFKGKLSNNRQKQNMTDHGGDLPTGWQQRTIGDLSKAIMPGFACNKSFQMTDGHVHLRTHNIDTNGKLNFDLLVKIDHKKVDMKKAQIHKGDIIFNNTNSQELVGKTCIVDRDYFYGFSNHLTLIKVIDEVEPTYIVYYFNLLLHIGYFAKLCNRWIGQAGINTKMLKPVLIPLPPLEEQKRIVAKVDQLMALCDELEARQQKKQEAHLRLNSAALDKLLTAHEPTEFAHHWQRICDNFDLLYDDPETVGELRKAILQLAVQGKLVPQDPNDEPAAVLLGEIKAEKDRLIREKKIRKSKPLSLVEMGEILFEIPESWEWLRFGDVTFNRDGERIPVSKEERSTLEKIYDYYGASGIIDKIDNYLFDKPLLLIGEDGANLINRSTPIAFIAKGKYWVNNHAHVLDGISLDFLRYLEIFINAIDLTPYVTGTAQPKMNQTKMNSIPLALPPFQEQRRIVAKVDQLMALCDDLESKLKQSQTDGEILMDAMVHQLVAT